MPCGIIMPPLLSRKLKEMLKTLKAPNCHCSPSLTIGQPLTIDYWCPHCLPGSHIDLLLFINICKGKAVHSYFLVNLQFFHLVWSIR